MYKDCIFKYDRKHLVNEEHGIKLRILNMQEVGFAI